MGRLVGLTHFLSQGALAEEKADASDIRRARGPTSEDVGDEEGVKDCRRQIALRMQHQFENRILRRTADSLNWQSKPLITLPPCREFAVMVKPTPREMEIISELADRVKER